MDISDQILDSDTRKEESTELVEVKCDPVEMVCEDTPSIELPGQTSVPLSSLTPKWLADYDNL